MWFVVYIWVVDVRLLLIVLFCIRGGVNLVGVVLVVCLVLYVC